jgi:hypothetical protein
MLASYSRLAITGFLLRLIYLRICSSVSTVAGAGLTGQGVKLLTVSIWRLLLSGFARLFKNYR